MTDIVERLRDHKNYSPLHREAADDIERMRAESDISDGLLADAQADNERLRTALQICASHSESSNYQGALSYVREVARRALEPKP